MTANDQRDLERALENYRLDSSVWRQTEEQLRRLGLSRLKIDYLMAEVESKRG